MIFLCVIALVATTFAHEVAIGDGPCVIPGKFGLFANSKIFFECTRNSAGRLSVSYFECENGEFFSNSIQKCISKSRSGVNDETKITTLLGEVSTVPTSPSVTAELTTVPSAPTQDVEGLSSAAPISSSSESITSSEEPNVTEEIASTTDEDIESTSEAASTTEEQESTTDLPVSSTEESVSSSLATDSSTSDPESTIDVSDSTASVSDVPEGVSESTTEENIYSDSTTFLPESTEDVSSSTVEEENSTTDVTDSTSSESDSTAESISTIENSISTEDYSVSTFEADSTSIATESTTEEQDLSTDSSVSTVSSSETNEEIIAPEFTCSMQGFFPVKSHCNEFYMCQYDGDGSLVAFKMACPRGQNFNPYTQYCVNDAIYSSCDTRNFLTGMDKFQCRTEGLYAHKKDCSLFYNCSLSLNKKKFLVAIQSCPRGQIFSLAASSCTNGTALSCLWRPINY